MTAKVDPAQLVGSSYPRLVSRAFEDQAHELRDVRVEVTGRVPEGLVGTLYRNAPTAFEWPDGRYRHWFDGHGQIHAVTFRPGEARYSNRFVQTQAFQRDQRSGRRSGAFGTPIPGGLLGVMTGAFTTRANINVLKLGDRLLALQEGGLPYALDSDLSTLGPDQLGFLKRGDGFTAHPHWDAERNLLVTASQSYGLTGREQLNVAMLDPSGRLRQRFPLKLPYAPMMVHDFGFTQSRLVVPLYPIFSNIPNVILGRETLGYDFTWEPQKGAFMVTTDRDGGDRRLIELPPMFSYHVANCYDESDTLVVDLMAYDSGEVVKWTGIVPWKGFVNPYLPQIRRLRMHRDGRVEVDALSELSLEFGVPHPAWLGKRHRYLYAAGATHANLRSEADITWQIARLDTERGDLTGWHAPHGQMLSEAIPVPKAGENREEALWLLAIAYDPESHRSRVVVLDAERLSEGPLAEVHLPHHMPPSVHGCFVPAD